MSVFKALQDLARSILGSAGQDQNMNARTVSLFEHLITPGGKQHDDEYMLFVRQELAVLRSEIALDTEVLIDRIVEGGEESGLRLITVLLASRAPSKLIQERLEQDQNLEVERSLEWWTGRKAAASTPSELIEYTAIVRSAPHRHKGNLEKTSAIELPKSEDEILRSAFRAIVRADFNHSYPDSCLQQVAETITICESDLLHARAIRRQSSCFLGMYEILEHQIFDLRGVVSVERQKIESLLLAERAMMQHLQRAQALLQCIRLVSTAESATLALQALNTRYRNCSSDMMGEITQRVLDRGLFVLRNFILAFLVSRDDIWNPDFLELMQSPLSSVIRTPSKISTPILPDFLGGARLAGDIAILRAVRRILVGMEFEDYVELTELSKETIASTTSLLAKHSLDALRVSLEKDLLAWYQYLLWTGTVKSSGMIKSPPKKSILSDELESVLVRCAGVLQTVVVCKEKCFGIFEMSSFVHALQTYFVQSVEYVIWPKLLSDIGRSRDFATLGKSLVEASLLIRETFLLNEGIHFLALDNLLSAVSNLDAKRYQKCLAFLVRCLDASPEGKKLLDLVDHNNFYRKIIET